MHGGAAPLTPAKETFCKKFPWNLQKPLRNFIVESEAARFCLERAVDFGEGEQGALPPAPAKETFCKKFPWNLQKPLRNFIAESGTVHLYFEVSLFFF